jgi:hypothetical protein
MTLLRPTKWQRQLRKLASRPSTCQWPNARVHPPELAASDVDFRTKLRPPIPVGCNDWLGPRPTSPGCLVYKPNNLTGH